MQKRTKYSKYKKKKIINIRYFFNDENVNSHKYSQFKIYFFNFNFYCYVICNNFL